MPLPVLSILTALLYGGLAWYCRHRAAQPENSARPGLSLLLVLPLALHGGLLYVSIFTEQGMNMGVGNALSAITWVTLLLYAATSVRYHLQALHPVVLPVAAGGALMPLLLRDEHVLPYGGLALFQAHFAAAFLAYALFTIAALHGLVMALAEKRLHAREPSALSGLPPLMTMERLLFRIIGAGFVLLTVTLASGMLFSEELFGKPLSFAYFTQHKTVFALLSWLIYGALLLGRRIYGWRGRTALIWSLAGFTALLLAYVGSKAVLEVLLHRG
ncbi:cytochrome C assembly family protein [Thiobacter aerophilum]|uniref:Cytochrome c biogenesis protein CcsA n=1 Tax=Thiobacter aerophilum TaxID=3121275 RepID=A0ABV0EFC3_9BURK